MFCTIYILAADVIVTKIRQGSDNSDITINWELLDENGICVESGGLVQFDAGMNKKYKLSGGIYGIDPGNYTLEFSDFYY